MKPTQLLILLCFLILITAPGRAAVPRIVNSKFTTNPTPAIAQSEITGLPDVVADVATKLGTSILHQPFPNSFFLANTTNFNGPSAAHHLNLDRQLNLFARLLTFQSPRILFLGDGAVVGGSSEALYVMASNMTTFLPRNGAGIFGSGVYLYSQGNADFVPQTFNDSIAPVARWHMADGERATNFSAIAPGGIPTTQLTLGYWLGNGHGTAALETNGVAVPGAVVDADNGGALTFATTNFYIPLSTVLASVVSTGTNIIAAVIGQQNTNLYGGFQLDNGNHANMNWERCLTNSAHSNFFRLAFAQYDSVLLGDLGLPERGAGLAEGLWSDASLRTDLIYLGAVGATNQLGANETTQSNLTWVAYTYHRPFVDVAGWWRPADPALQQQYFADVVHPSPAGARRNGQLLVNTLGWTQPQLAGLGYTNRAVPDVTSKANLTGGNYITGVQTYSGGNHWLSNQLSLIGPSASLQLWDQGSLSANQYWNLRRVGQGVMLIDPVSGNLPMLSVSNTSGTIHWHAAGTPVLGQANPFRVHASDVRSAGTVWATNGIRNGTAYIQWVSGSGSPEGAVTAPIGSLYSRTDGGAGTSLYVKESGTGNTGWVPK